MPEISDAPATLKKKRTLGMSAGRLRRPLGATLFTVLVVGLVALALVGMRSWWFIGSLLAIVIAATAFFHVIFPGTRFFAVAFANSLAAYECIFSLFVEANFGGVGTPVLVAGFALPIVAFCLAAGLQRQRVRAVIEAEEHGEPRVARALTWLLPVFAIGALTFALPRLGLGQPALDLAFLASMAAIATTVLLVGPTIAAFLIDTGLLFEAFFEQMSRAFVAAFAFLTFYSVLVIVFAALYRILSLVSPAPDFIVAGQPGEISFVESLYFSVITMATVGYGDITPLSDLARLIAAVQVVVGILLLLFGFSEILSYTRDRGRRSSHRQERPPPTDLG
jgi:voltage-gated potassium channel